MGEQGCPRGVEVGKIGRTPKQPHGWEHTKADQALSPVPRPRHPTPYLSRIIFVRPSYQILGEARRHDIVPWDAGRSRNPHPRGRFYVVGWNGKKVHLCTNHPPQAQPLHQKAVTVSSGQTSAEPGQRHLAIPHMVDHSTAWPLTTTRRGTRRWNLYQSFDQSYEHPRPSVDQATKSKDPYSSNEKKNTLQTFSGNPKAGSRRGKVSTNIRILVLPGHILFTRV